MISVGASIFNAFSGLAEAAGAVLEASGPLVGTAAGVNVNWAGFELCSAVIATKTGATALLKLSSVSFSIVPLFRSGLLNHRTWPERTMSGTSRDPGTSY